MLTLCDICNPIYEVTPMQQVYTERKTIAHVYQNGNGHDQKAITFNYAFIPEPDNCAKVEIRVKDIPSVENADDLKEDIYHAVSDDLDLLVTEINFV